MYMVMHVFNFKDIFKIYFFYVSECDRHGVSVMCLCVCVSFRVYVRSKRNESECLDMCTCDRP